MAKRRRGATSDKMNRWIKEGRGCGRGEEYKPWLEIHDVASMGRSTRMKGWKTNRIHHFLSDLERDYFLLLDWNDNVVVDIREQYPLLPIEETLQIADELSLEHPKDPKTKEYNVMTTDFLITIKKDDTNIDVARTLKYCNDLDDYRTIEKFEIERRYWQKKQCNWGIVTENEIPKIMAENIRNIHQSIHIDMDKDLEDKDVNLLSTILIKKLKRSKESIVYVTNEFEQELRLADGLGLKIFKFLLASKAIQIDMRTKIDFTSIKSNEISFRS